MSGEEMLKVGEAKRILERLVRGKIQHAAEIQQAIRLLQAALDWGETEGVAVDD